MPARCSREWHFHRSKKAKKIVVVMYYLHAGALIWRFQICIDQPISKYSILRNFSPKKLPKIQ